MDLLMADKIKDGITGGTYSEGLQFEMFAPERDLSRLGVTGKFNKLVDEVGQISELTTDDKTSLINAINEIDINADASVKLDDSLQTIIGSINFGQVIGTNDKVLFKHDVEFEGEVRFSGGSGDTLNLNNTFISLGDDTAETPVGDGGIILERGNNLEDSRVFWDESTNEWKLKSGTNSSHAILHKGISNSNALSYLLTGDLNASDLIVAGTDPFLRITDTANTFNGKIWDIKSSSTSEDFVITGVSDDTISTYNAYRINRSGSNITGHQFYVNNSIKLRITDTNIFSAIPIKIDTIAENTLDNGVLIDTLKIKDEAILNGATSLVKFINTGSLFNPTSASLDFTINGNGTEAFLIDASESKIFNRYNSYFDQTVFVDRISQRNSSGIHLEDFTKVSDTFMVEASTPTIRLFETDQATNSKYWDINSNASSLGFSTQSDNLSNPKLAYNITRTVASPTSHNFYVGDNIDLKLTSNTLDFGNNVLATNSNLNIITKDGNNATLSFKQGSVVKTSLEYIDSSNVFNINQFLDNGTYLGGLSLTQTDVIVKTLPLSIESDIKVNTINPYSGTLTTVNQNLNVNGILSTNSDKLIFGTNSDQDDRIEFNEASNEFRFIENGVIRNSIVKAGSFSIFESNAPLNEKTTRLGLYDFGGFAILNESDDGSTSSTMYSSDKNGTATSNHNFYIGDNVDLSIQNNNYKIGNSVTSGAAETQLLSKVGDNVSLSFRQGTAIKGNVGYTDSSNIFSINRYADSNGALLGSIDLLETKILVKTLPLEVDTNIKVNDIVERTSGHGVDIDGVLLKDLSITALNGTFTSNINIDGQVRVNDIVERTSGHGVDIDGVLLKDGDGTFTGGQVTIEHSVNPFQEYHVTGGNSGYNKPRITVTDDAFAIQTRNSVGTFVSTDYGIVRGASGATAHLFNIGNVEKLRLDNTGLQVSGILSVLGDKLIFGTNSDQSDRIEFDDALNKYSFVESNTVSGTIVEAGTLQAVDRKIIFGSNIDYIQFNESSNKFSFYENDSIANSIVECGVVQVNDIVERTSGHGVAIDGVLLKDGGLDVNNSITSSQGQVASTWVSCDLSGSIVINDDYNVSTITKNGTGDFYINFSNNLPNNNYAVSVSSDEPFLRVLERDVNRVRVTIHDFAFNLHDPDFLSVIIFSKQ